MKDPGLVSSTGRLLLHAHSKSGSLLGSASSVSLFEGSGSFLMTSGTWVVIAVVTSLVVDILLVVVSDSMKISSTIVVLFCADTEIEVCNFHLRL